MGKGVLYLIPSSLGEITPERSFPSFNTSIISSLRHFITEEIKTARRFIRKVCPDFIIEEAEFMIFNEHSLTFDLSPYLTPLLNGMNVGLLSEAGLPCIADPGSAIVMEAHRKQIHVVPLIGPSSLFLALMASGFNGQNFIFHGYLPVEKQDREKKIREIERNAYSSHQTQIMIETPYRNLHLFESLISVCREITLICIASELTTPAEYIQTRSVSSWKGTSPPIHKHPTVFLLHPPLP
ncbi:MAG: SAM-dependent methyltransferase [Bacteroidota bacterium]